MTRRFLLALALAIGTAACGDDDIDVTNEDAATTSSTEVDSTTSTSATPSGPPAILVLADGEVVRISDAGTATVGHVGDDAEVAYGDGRGTVVVEVGDRLVLLVDGSTTPLDIERPGRPLLFDVDSIDGEPHALYGVRLDGDDREPSGDVVLHNLETGGEQDLGTGYAVEYHTYRGSLAGGLAVTSAYSDLTEAVDFRPLGDEPVPSWSPTTGLEYNEPPLIADVVLAPDGRTLAWLSGPDASGRASEPEQIVGTWEVVVADLDGNERHRIPIDVSGGAIPDRLDYDGTRLLLSRRAGDTHAPALLIELDDVAESVTVTELALAGIATFDG